MCVRLGWMFFGLKQQISESSSPEGFTQGEEEKDYTGGELKEIVDSPLRVSRLAGKQKESDGAVGGQSVQSEMGKRRYAGRVHIIEGLSCHNRSA